MRVLSFWLLSGALLFAQEEDKDKPKTDSLPMVSVEKPKVSVGVRAPTADCVVLAKAAKFARERAVELRHQAEEAMAVAAAAEKEAEAAEDAARRKIVEVSEKVKEAQGILPSRLAEKR